MPKNTTYMNKPDTRKKFWITYQKIKDPNPDDFTGKLYQTLNVLHTSSGQGQGQVPNLFYKARLMLMWHLMVRYKPWNPQTSIPHERTQKL